MNRGMNDMCGIIGIATVKSFFKCDGDFFKQALLCDQVRGTDATGLFKVNLQDKLVVHKKGMPAGDYLDLGRAKSLVNGYMNNMVMVGHNRAATKGALNSANAHPFTCGGITLVHNGTLRSYHGMHGYKATEVDSKVLCGAINEGGIQKAVDSIITGAYSLVWYDTSDSTLNFLRNSERPMAIALSKDGDSIYFASEIGMLSWLLERNKIAYQSITETTPNMHLKLDMMCVKLEPEITEVKRVVKINITKKPANKPNLTVIKRELPHGWESKIGEREEAFIDKWVPYKDNESLGRLIGVTSTKPYIAVEVHNITKKHWEGKGTYTIGVANIIWDDLDYLMRGVAPKFSKPSQEPPSKKKSGSQGSSDLESDAEEDKDCKDSSSKNYGVAIGSSYTPADMLENLIDFDDEETCLLKGPRGEHEFSLKEYDYATRDGCANCSANLGYSDAATLTWHDSNTPICHNCQVEFEYDVHSRNDFDANFRGYH